MSSGINFKRGRGALEAQMFKRTGVCIYLLLHFAVDIRPVPTVANCITSLGCM